MSARIRSRIQGSKQTGLTRNTKMEIKNRDEDISGESKKIYNLVA